jgi:chromosome segregation ATPase
MEPTYSALPLNLAQSALVENSTKIQDLGAKLLKSFHKKTIKLERKIKKKKDQIKSLESDLEAVQQQLLQLVPSQSSYENAIGLLMETLGFKPPYQGTLIYDKSKPIALRMPDAATKNTNS